MGNEQSTGSSHSDVESKSNHHNEKSTITTTTTTTGSAVDDGIDDHHHLVRPQQQPQPQQQSFKQKLQNLNTTLENKLNSLSFKMNPQQQQQQLEQFNIQQIDDDFILIDNKTLNSPPPPQETSTSTKTINRNGSINEIINNRKSKEYYNHLFSENRVDSKFCQLSADMIFNIFTFLFFPIREFNENYLFEEVDEDEDLLETESCASDDDDGSHKNNNLNNNLKNNLKNSKNLNFQKYKRQLLYQAYNLNCTCQHISIHIWQNENYSNLLWKFIFENIIPHSHPFYQSNFDQNFLKNCKNMKIYRNCKYGNSIFNTFKLKCKLYHSYSWKVIQNCCKLLNNSNSNSMMNSSSSFILLNNENGELLDASLLKIILIGNHQIGKTSLLSCYMNNNNTKNLKNTTKIEPTIGFDFTSLLIRVRENRFNLFDDNKLANKYSCGFQIWDCSDLESNEICESVFKDADAVLLCYDCNNLQSFLDLKNVHFTKLARYITKVECLPKIVVGLKSDLECKVSDSMVMDFVKQNDMTFVKTTTTSCIKNDHDDGGSVGAGGAGNYVLPFNYIIYANRQEYMMVGGNSGGGSSMIGNVQMNESLDLALLNMFLNYENEHDQEIDESELVVL